MTRARIFVNDFPRQLIKASVTREGNRAIDQAKFIVCPATPICVTDQVVYVQDMANLDRLNLLYNFCQHIKDESGYQHHPLGHTDFPSALSHWDFQCTVEDLGKLQNTATELPLDCMCVETPSVFTCGKVMCNNDVNDKAILFACMRYLTIEDECEYDLRQDQKWTMSAWVYPTSSAADAMIMGKRVGITACDAGYSLNLNMCCANISFEIANGTCEWCVTSTACSVPLCMWTNVTAVFDGTSNQSGMKIYISGDLNATGAACVITTPVVNCAVFSIGATACTTDHYSGRLDGVYFFDKELNACESASLFHEGGLEYICGLWNGKAVTFDGCKGHLVIEDNAPQDPQPCNLKLQLKFECDLVDSSCTNSCITMGTGCATFANGLIDNKSFTFDTCRYVTICCATNFNFDKDNEFSTSFWVKPGCGAAGNDGILTKRLNFGAAAAGWSIHFNATNDRVTFELSNGACEHILTSVNCTVPKCEWTHIITTYDGKESELGMRIFVNGIPNVIGTDCAITGSLLNCLTPAVGAGSCGFAPFSGLIDCVRVWDKVITSDEALGLYEATFGKFNTKYCIVTWIKVGTCHCDRTIFNKAS